MTRIPLKVTTTGAIPLHVTGGSPPIPLEVSGGGGGGSTPSMDDLYAVLTNAQMTYVPQGETVYIRYKNDTRDRFPVITAEGGGAAVSVTNLGTTALGVRTFTFTMPAYNVIITWQY